jgi:hypothetical protein
LFAFVCLPVPISIQVGRGVSSLCMLNVAVSTIITQRGHHRTIVDTHSLTQSIPTETL